LRNTVRGGTSLFVDSFHAASSLEAQEFDVLARTPVYFHYMNDAHHLHCAHQTLEVDPLKLAPSAKLDVETLQHVNYSPPFQAPLDPDTPITFYKALQSFATHLAKPERVLSHRMRPGDAVLFDNRRVLHARTGFGRNAAEEESSESASKQGDDQGERWLKGCYLEADAMDDRRRVLLDNV
jgi:gamma-butyrobetaine dioxygenase